MIESGLTICEFSLNGMPMKAIDVVYLPTKWHHTASFIFPITRFLYFWCQNWTLHHNLYTVVRFHCKM